MVHHTNKINHISIEEELRVLVSSGEDGLVVLANLFSGNLIRILRFTEGIKWAKCLSYPYTMIALQSGEKQLCYSINGQYLDEAQY
jgi:hypothetical protein